MIDAAEHTQKFWLDPETALIDLMREARRESPSQYRLVHDLQAISEELYPREGFPLSTLYAWANWSDGEFSMRQRRPTLPNGVRLFQVLLAWHRRH